MKQAKIWGKTELIFKTYNFEIHRIEIKKNGYCSTHKHRYKNNLFYIESGKLEITIYEKSTIDKGIFSKGDTVNVRNGVYHNFGAIENCIAYEIYYINPINSGDIKRKSAGGIETGLTKYFDKIKK